MSPICCGALEVISINFHANELTPALKELQGTEIDILAGTKTVIGSSAASDMVLPFIGKLSLAA
jgi:hypothetical protein